MKTIFIIISIVYLGVLYSAQITLVDGTVIQGEVLSSNQEELMVKVPYSNEPITIKKDQVINIGWDDAGVPPTPTPTADPFVNPSPQPQSHNPFTYEPSYSNPGGDFTDVAFNLNLAGNKLVAFKKQYYGGLTIIAISFLLILASDGDEDMVIPASIGMLVGQIMQMTSFTKAGEAGEKLNLAANELEKMR